MTQRQPFCFRKRTLSVFAAVVMATLTIAGPANAAPGDVTTLAGSGTAGFANGTGTAASFNRPLGIAVDGSGNVYVADNVNHVIRKVASGGVVSTLAGSGSPGSADGLGSAASFYNPFGVAVDGVGNVYVADTNNYAIRKVTPAGLVSTLAGSGFPGSADGTGSAASFGNPYGVAVDGVGNVYVADYSNNTIRKVTPGGVVTTLAGSGAPGSVDATGTSASFDRPAGVAVDGSGTIYVADSNNHKIRKVTPGGVVSTLAGTGLLGSSDGPGSGATFRRPNGVAVDAAGNVLVADRVNHLIRVVSPAGVVSTLAGTGSSGSSNGLGTSASFNQPYAVAVDSTGNAYIADYGNHLIRQIEAASAGVSMVQPLPLLVAGFAACIGGLIVQTRRRSARPTLTPTI
jgi:sugar lactone lactonase YvrE